MVRYCCICKTEQGMIPNVSFYGIPKKEEMKAKWIINIGQEVNKNSSVCSRHFKDKDYCFKLIGETVKRTLVPTAIPSNELLYNNDYSEQILENVTNDTSNIISYTCIENNMIDDPNVIYIVEDENLQPSTSNSNFSDSKGINNETVDNEDSLTLSDYEKDEVSDDFDSNDDYESKTLLRNLDETLTNTKHLSNPRNIRDLQREHFTSDIGWHIVHKYIQKSKRKRKVLNNRVKRLNNELENLKSILDYVKSLKQNTVEASS